MKNYAIEGINDVLAQETDHEVKLQCIDVYIKAREEFKEKYGSSLHAEDYQNHEAKKRDYALNCVKLYIKNVGDENEMAR